VKYSHRPGWHQLIEQMVDLEPLWKVAGSSEGKSPQDWLKGRGKQVLEHRARVLGVEPSCRAETRTRCSP